VTDDNERQRQRYADDPEYRMRKVAQARAFYKCNKVEINAKRRLRWATDPDFCERKEAENEAYRKRNKTKINVRRRLRYATDVDFRERKIEANRATKLKSCYGLTIEQYNTLLTEQKGRCALCKKTSTRRLCVDHCHRTGLVRRLLCHKCNSALGFLNDDARLLRGGASYVTRDWKPKSRAPGKPARKKRR
jgi:recombination endonuclease VII